MQKKTSIALFLSLMAISLLASNALSDTYTPYETVAFQLIGNSVVISNDSTLERYNVTTASGTTNTTPAFWYKVGAAGSWTQMTDGSFTISNQNGQTLYLGIYPASAQSSSPWITSADGSGGAKTWTGVTNGMVVGDGLGVSFDHSGSTVFIDWDSITFTSGTVNWNIRNAETSLNVTTGSLAPVPIPAAAWLAGHGSGRHSGLKEKEKG